VDPPGFAALLDALIAAAPGQRALAWAIGVPPSRVSLWRRRAPLSLAPHVAARLERAPALCNRIPGGDPGGWVLAHRAAVRACIDLERAGGPPHVGHRWLPAAGEPRHTLADLASARPELTTAVARLVRGLPVAPAHLTRAMPAGEWVAVPDRRALDALLSALAPWAERHPSGGAFRYTPPPPT
jgi:hypothetical protein